ncbi:PDDEXK family nuclease [Paenibacillus arenilitoris]|uniref:DNA-binding response regulator n=1 Tax=Paenibacillus arenilitoris TaxID=2772299 RepID=A0A927CI63_9BACL|nr:DNA-binding response regulator [Paenibacillus arenilitoris]MBD2867945.1 DNA-binding response regulator [Paenibacillus arenilitoris]
MNFEEAHALFIQKHLSARKGEALRRLKTGHDHAEKLFLQQAWWPAFGDFNDLHPEYETYDYKDGNRYIDFGYIRSRIRLAIEIDGYGPHWRNLDRTQFANQLRRQNDLVIDGWIVLRFSYDDIKEHPRFCQQKLQQLMGRLLGTHPHEEDIGYLEKEIIRLAMRTHGPITPSDVGRHLGIDNKTARKWLRGLVDKKRLKPSGGDLRIRSYELERMHSF